MVCVKASACLAANLASVSVALVNLPSPFLVFDAPHFLLTLHLRRSTVYIVGVILATNPRLRPAGQRCADALPHFASVKVWNRFAKLRGR
jgi:hypothetical protein